MRSSADARTLLAVFSLRTMGSSDGHRRCLPALVAGALLFGCATVPPSPAASADDEVDAAPAAPPPGLAELPDPVVRPLPKSARGNNPYTVWGKDYDVLPSAEGYDQTGLASWYGTKFNGRLTSSGEVYDMYKLTAAHRALPIPTFVRVTNLDNGRSSIVRVNDRGPFHPHRIIDLSYAAAVKLGFQDNGTARVRVQSVAVVGSEQKKPASSRSAPFFVRAGRFDSFAQAETLRREVAALLNEDAFVIRAEGGLTVRIGPLTARQDVERLRALLLLQGQTSVTVED